MIGTGAMDAGRDDDGGYAALSGLLWRQRLLTR
jgi:hypothetical protein